MFTHNKVTRLFVNSMNVAKAIKIYTPQTLELMANELKISLHHGMGNNEYGVVAKDGKNIIIYKNHDLWYQNWIEKYVHKYNKSLENMSIEKIHFAFDQHVIDSLFALAGYQIETKVLHIPIEFDVSPGLKSCFTPPEIKEIRNMYRQDPELKKNLMIKQFAYLSTEKRKEKEWEIVRTLI